jgi:hypothetical protein
VVAALGALAFRALPLAGAVEAEMSSSHAATGEEMARIRGYSDQLGRELLKEDLGIDLDALQVELDPTHYLHHQSQGPAQAQGAGLGPGPAPGLPSYLRLRLEQTDDLRHLQEGLSDLPFGLSLDAQLPLLSDLFVLQTKLWVPFSWREEIRAEATVPLLGGLSHPLLLRSDYRNQLGLSHWEAGLGTGINSDTFGLWDVDYDFQRKFGQGEDAAIHWLKFSRHF